LAAISSNNTVYSITEWKTSTLARTNE